MTTLKFKQEKIKKLERHQ